MARATDLARQNAEARRAAAVSDGIQAALAKRSHAGITTAQNLVLLLLSWLKLNDVLRLLSLHRDNRQRHDYAVQKVYR